MKINLFTTIFISSNKKRNFEQETSLNKNISNKYIDKIYLFSEDDVDTIKSAFDIIKSDKVEIINLTARPKFLNIINYINSKEYFKYDINVIANSDIFFDKTIELSKEIDSNEMYALTRWDKVEEKKNNKFTIFNTINSQDSWFFKGHIKQGIYCDFYFGILGCDNRFAYECYKVGYNVRNPSLSVRSMHEHMSEYRTYSKDNIIPRPYASVLIGKL